MDTVEIDTIEEDIVGIEIIVKVLIPTQVPSIYSAS